MTVIYLRHLHLNLVLLNLIVNLNQRLWTHGLNLINLLIELIQKFKKY